MYYRSLLSKSLRGCRQFSSSPRLNLDLAHEVYPATSTPNRPIIFMHGLFGSKQNNRSISKVLTKELNTSIYTIDLRNHGDSPHAPEHNYSVMADDVAQFINRFQLKKPVLLGHSMGAKTAMTLALKSPDLISAFVSVDNAPVSARLGNDFATYVRAMIEIEESNVKDQKEAHKILERVEPSLPIRQFLLTNLVRKGDEKKLSFRIPLQTLRDTLDNLASFPFSESDSANFDGPALFIRGTRSRYVKDKSIPLIRHFFPSYELADVDAGHWLISENPEGFKTVVTDFLKRLP